MPDIELSIHDATMIAEGVQAADDDTVVAAWQKLHDTDVAYQLQGSFGRTAARLVQQGVIAA